MLACIDFSKTPARSMKTVRCEHCLGFVEAAVRTNWFQTDDAGELKPYAAFKLDSAKLSDPGAITPFREIFVCSDDMEGIHARSGPVARGGLRFSDRPESYRTEVLELLKTQIIKNAPIVPEGAKGAFVLRSGSITLGGRLHHFHPRAARCHRQSSRG